MRRCTGLTHLRKGKTLTLVLLTACGGASDSSGPKTSTEPQRVSTILYEVGDSAGVRLALTNLDGSNTRALPCPELYCLDGEISPDGKQLLVTGEDATGARRQYVMGTDGSNPKLVAQDPIASMLPTWRRDGEAFYSYNATGSQFVQSRAYVTVIATGVSQPIEPTAFHSGLPTQSPDGKQLVFASNRRVGPLEELYSLDLTSNTALPAPITIAGLPAGAGTSTQPRFSPSGEIAFTYFASGGSNFDVWIMSPGGTNARPIANSTMRESAPDWSPDGAYIVYVRSPALNVNEIVIARVSDGSILRTIPEPKGGTVNNPRWGLIR